MDTAIICNTGVHPTTAIRGKTGLRNNLYAQQVGKRTVTHLSNHSMNPPFQYNRRKVLQAAPRTGRTHWWSRLPGLSSTSSKDKTEDIAASPVNPPPSSPPLIAPPFSSAAQDVDSFSIPTITVRPADSFLSVSSALPEAIGIIDPTLLHAPFLREPLFVPSPGSGRKALAKWIPEGYYEEESSVAHPQGGRQETSSWKLLPIKCWLHYAEPELYLGIGPGQALQLCDNAQPGHRYEVRGEVGSVGPGIAFWAEPQEGDHLPLAAVLFLPPGTSCPSHITTILQVLASDAINFARRDAATTHKAEA